MTEDIKEIKAKVAEAFQDDVNKGIMTLGKYDFEAQFIGSESMETNTWLWGWANNSIPNKDVLKDIKEIKEFGEEMQDEVLCSEGIETEEGYDGFFYITVAQAIQGAPFYYSFDINKGKGKAYFLLYPTFTSMVPHF